MFHDDWELYGDGSGDIEELMFDPARRVLDVCNRYGLKYTFFAEVGQQFAMKASSNPAHQKAAAQWELLLTGALAQGHDVQLHLHPQWIGATHDGRRWILDLSKCAIGRLSRDEMALWLTKSRDYFTTLLTPHKADYAVRAFRAGGFMAQPSTNLLSVLKEIGVGADVTVIPGMKVADQGFGWVDFTAAPSALEPWVPSDSDVARAGGRYENFFCIPTRSRATTLPVPLFSFLKNPLSLAYSLRKVLREKKRGYTPLHQWKKEPAPPRTAMDQMWSLPRAFFKERILLCDFGQLHWSTVLRLVNEAIRDGERRGLSEMPLILYTHSKQFFGRDNFETLAQHLVKNKNILFETTQSAVQHWHETFSRA